MKTFNQFQTECWKTHKKVGMKMKGGKLVNDCRPRNEETCGCGQNPCITYGAENEKKRKNALQIQKVIGEQEKEGDHEFEMARRQLHTMKNAAKKLEKKMGKKGEGNLKAWVQSKITKAADYADTAADYVTKEDWQSVNRKDKTDGLSQKAVNAYRKENPGSKLKTAVTTKPSKLKKGSKSAKRRSSFCSRMKGMKKRLTSAKTARDPDSRINKALRRWNCN